MGQSWRSAAIHVCVAFGLALGAISGYAPSVRADDAAPSAPRQDAASNRKQSLESHLARGFVELHGKAAMAFLAGNSILRTDAKAPWKVAYVLDAHSAYLCDSLDATRCSYDDLSDGEDDLHTRLCEINTDAGLDYDCVTPALLMAPKGYGKVDPSDGSPWWAGEIGVYVRGDGKLSPVLAGRWIDVPEYSLEAKPELLTAPASELAPYVPKGEQWQPGEPNELVITLPIAKAFLIGNTALLPESPRQNKGDVVCPGVADYYAPDGRQIRLGCVAYKPEVNAVTVKKRIDSIEILRWKYIAGHFCWTSVDEAPDDYGCAPRLISSPVDKTQPDGMYSLKTWDGQIYKGNVLNVRQ